MTPDEERLVTLGLVGLGFSHELRTPLTTTLLALELLRERLQGTSPPSPAEAAAEIARASGQLRRMARLLEHLRGLALASEGRHVPCSLDAVLDATVELARPALVEQRGVELARGAPVPQASVLADPVLLEQAAIGMVLNAADALAPAGGGTIHLAAVALADGFALEVRDDGPGFRDAGLARQPGATGRPGEGMGIGLALTERIARDSGARLLVDAAPGGGARVRIVFPRG